MIKKIINPSIPFLIFCFVLFLLNSEKSNGQNSISLSNNTLPNLYNGQKIKSIIYIIANKPGATKYVLSKKLNTDSVKWEVQNLQANNQAWYLIEDENKNLFSLLNFADKSWLKVDSNNISNTFIAKGFTLKSSNVPTTSINSFGASEVTNDYLFEFFKPLYAVNNVTTITGNNLYGINSYRARNSFSQYSKSPIYIDNWSNANINLWKTFSNKDSSIALAYTANMATFNIQKINSQANGFIPVMFQSSPYFQQLTTNPILNVNTTLLIGNNNTSNSGGNYAISYLGKTLSNPIDTLLRLDFSKSKNSYIGWLSYEKSIYTMSFYNNLPTENIKPRVGVGVYNNKLYFMNEGIVDTLTTATNFSKLYPIFLSYKNGVFSVCQKVGATSYIKTYNTVPIRSIMSLNASHSVQLLAKLQYKDSLLVSYIPTTYLFSNNLVGTYSSFATTSSNPDFFNNGTLNPKFDWRTQEYNLRFLSNGNVINQIVPSPFYSSNSNFKGIAAKYNATGTLIGGQDNNPYSGWELIKADIGYEIDGSPTVGYNLRNEPYLIFYNKLQGILRVFIYINNSSIANQFKLQLSAYNSGMYGNTGNGTGGQYKPPFIWDSYLRGVSLDQDSISNQSYYKCETLNSSSSGQFYYADYQMSYDPCISFFESSIQVSLEKITNGNVSLVGKSLGGSLPGSNQITNFINKNNNFLAGVLNTPYNALSQTLGDITLNNYRSWGIDSAKNYVQTVTPSTQINPMEIEALRLDYLSAKKVYEQSTSSATLGTDIAKGIGGIISGIGGPIAGVIGGAVTAIPSILNLFNPPSPYNSSYFSSESARIRYEYARDNSFKPGDTLKIKNVDVQPSLVFSDIALQGTVNIVSPIFDNVIITTPGSKNANYAPLNYVNGSKGSLPLYNEPLGVGNLLVKPQFALSVVRSNSSTYYDANIAIKEYPVIVLNQLSDVKIQSATAQFSISTYNNLGSRVSSLVSKSFLLVNDESGLDILDKLPANLNINQLVDWSVVESNFIQNNGSSLTNAQIQELLKNWIKIDLKITFTNLAEKDPDGLYTGGVISTTYKGDVAVRYSSSNNCYVDGNAYTQLAQNYSNYNRSNNVYFGNTHLFTNKESVFNNLMNNYCNNHQQDRIVQYVALKNSNNSVDSTVKLSLKNENKEILVYPNPTSNKVFLEYPVVSLGNINISLFDMMGNKILTHKEFSNDMNETKKATLDIAYLPTGNYLILIEYANQEKKVSKIIKK